MNRFGVTDLGPVPRMNTDRVGPFMPRVPKMRRTPAPKIEPIVSVTVEKPVLPRKLPRKTASILKDKPRENLIKLPPPLTKRKSLSPQRKPKTTNVAWTPRKRTSQKEQPRKFTGKETMRLKPVPVAIGLVKTKLPGPSGEVKADQKKHLKPKGIVRWRF